jgi:general secretion pathway protein J
MYKFNNINIINDKKDNRCYGGHYRGFTLIELMIAIMIFAVITVISYRVISALVKTKEVITSVHNKWGSLSNTVNRLNQSMYQVIPLAVRNGDGGLIPALNGKAKLEGKFDAQLELTESGFIGDQIYGSVAPKRIGYRFINGRIYLITWPVLNQVINTVPRVDVLLENVQSFKVTFLYTDKQWYNTWPADSGNLTALPVGIKVNIKLSTAEEVVRQWAL